MGNVKGDTRSLDYNSYRNLWVLVLGIGVAQIP